MSLDDTENAEIELQDLVTQVLEDNGLLSKIRAQLRAGLYLALENDINVSENYTTFNKCLKSKLTNPDIRIIFCLIREFFEYFQLSYTASVFEKETFMGTAYSYENREKLAENLDIGINVIDNAPLILQILNIARNKYTEAFKTNEINVPESVKHDNTDAHNTTYKIPSILERSNSEQTDYSLSDSLIRETPQHIIGVKTVLKETLINSEQSNSFVQGSDYHNIVKDRESSSNQIPPQLQNKQANTFEADDTYEGTSSIAEDSIFSVNKEQSILIDFDKTLKYNPNTSSAPFTPTKTLIDQTIDEKSSKLSASPESQGSDKKNFKYEKTERTDKLKPMSGLTSLSDLPPLQINKSRNTDKPLLPSLYLKDFRDKSSLKEVDTLVEMNYESFDNYEEDFTSSGSIDNDASLNSELNVKESSFSSKKQMDSVNSNEISNDNISVDVKTKSANDSDSNSAQSLTFDKVREPSI